MGFNIPSDTCVNFVFVHRSCGPYIKTPIYEIIQLLDGLCFTIPLECEQSFRSLFEFGHYNYYLKNIYSVTYCFQMINGEHMEWDLYYYLSGKKPAPAEVRFVSLLSVKKNISLNEPWFIPSFDFHYQSKSVENSLNSIFRLSIGRL